MAAKNIHINYNKYLILDDNSFDLVNYNNKES